MEEKIIHELRVIETEDGFRIEIKGDKEQLRGVVNQFTRFASGGRPQMPPFMRGFGFGRGRHGHHGHGFGPWGWNQEPENETPSAENL